MADEAKVVAIQMEIADESDKLRNLETGCNLLEEAGERKPDLACLPELFTGLKTVSSIPGPETERIGGIARRSRMYVVAPYYVRQNEGLFNCSVLFDRQGIVCGIYRKVHLWPWESPVFGVKPGTEFPVFNLDFGVIGLCICHDHQFPETARILALKGAEIICCSTRMPDPFQMPWLQLSWIRALENQVFVVSVGSSANDCSTHIVAPLFRGAPIASAGVGTHLLDGLVNLGWLRRERQLSALYEVPRAVPSDEAAQLLMKVESYCFLKERKPELYDAITDRKYSS